MVRVLTQTSFVELVESVTGEAVDDLDAALGEQGLDSFHLMELVARLDALGIVLDEDALARAETLASLYGECLRAAAGSIDGG